MTRAPSSPERTPSSPDIERAAAFLEARFPVRPTVGLVLGSGLGHLVEQVEEPVAIPFESVPGLPPSGVPGHSGNFVVGGWRGGPVLVQAGRYHAYEGHSMATAVAPIRIAARLGVRVLVVTNAAGGLDPAREPGDLVMLDDHINLTGRNPLVGAVRPGEPRFPDMSAPYDPALADMAARSADRSGIQLHRGVYVGVLGPSFETAAEVRMLARLGGHVVGMSTVPEVITARALGLRCVAFSVVTNKGTGLEEAPVSHDQVVEVGRTAGRSLVRLLDAMAGELFDAAQSMGAK